MAKRRKKSAFKFRRMKGNETTSLMAVVVVAGLAVLALIGAGTGVGSSSKAPLYTLLVIALSIAWVFWSKHAASERRRLDMIRRQQGIESIRALSWEEFEAFTAELFRQQGYRVAGREQGGADGGIDLVLHRNGETVLVQCKHWKSTTVGAPIVREMLGLITHHRAVAAKVVCSGRFTRQAEEFARGKPIELIDGETLWRQVTTAQANINRRQSG